MANALIKHLLEYEHLNESETELIINSFETVTLNTDDFFLKEGQICKNVGFIATGLMMYYRISEEGQEIVCDFASEHDWITQYQSFIAQSQSPLSIKAIEPSIIQSISFDNINKLYEKVPRFERIARQLVEKVFFGMVKATDDFRILKAEERYEKLLAENPLLLQRVPQYYIASYLGIAPQSLSRIRKNILG
ncbi:MAG: Crp/Fnr family transcriptional regulator [Verrucomicrobia bacterium]|nr:Crp/Fnr family transcriptional regulator [Cytophagales bacterium]